MYHNPAKIMQFEQAKEFVQQPDDEEGGSDATGVNWVQIQLELCISP
jgi:hypothetical protein